MASLRQGGAAQLLEPIALMGLARNGAVEGETVLIGCERFGCRVGPAQGRVLESEGSAARWTSRLSRRLRACLSGGSARWNRGPFWSSV